MPKVNRVHEESIVSHGDHLLNKEELDTKHLAALDSKALVSWNSPERVFKSRSTKYFINNCKCFLRCNRQVNFCRIQKLQSRAILTIDTECMKMVLH